MSEGEGERGGEGRRKEERGGRRKDDEDYLKVLSILLRTNSLEALSVFIRLFASNTLRYKRGIPYCCKNTQK
jgi:hypothetical protein